MRLQPPDFDGEYVCVLAVRWRRGTLPARLAAGLAWLAASGAVMASTWSLLPQPAELHPAASGVVTIADGAAVAVRGAKPEDIQPTADRFMKLVAESRGLRLHSATAADTHPAITFEVDSHATVGADAGYRVVIGTQGIQVIARTPEGAFYGSVTLWQLLTPPGWASGTAAEIPQGTIEDQPRFAWRALLLDSGRHFQSVPDIEKLIDWMSLEKLNVLLWHLTEDQGWRLEIPRYPELTKTGACRTAVGLDIQLTGDADKPYCRFYNEAEVREIVRHAAARFVTVVPEIDLPGHSQAAVAAYPWLGVTGERPPVWTDWGVSPWLLKPDEKTLQFVNDVLDEVMRLFPSRYISIGGDEADKRQWDASPEVRAQMQRLGLANMDQLQGWFTGRIAEYLTRNGRTPVGWDDELVAGAALPAAQVVMSWHGSDGQQVALKAARQGHAVVLAPEGSLYFDHYQSALPDEGPGPPPMVSLRQVYDTAVIPSGATEAQAMQVLGVQGALWTEFIPTFGDVQHALYPRTAALSELAWSSARAHDWNGFLQRLTAQLSRYRALGIGYADSAFAPAFAVTAGSKETLSAALSNQAGFGEIRYTTDGSAPTPASTPYLRPVERPVNDGGSLRAATYGPGGFELAAQRTQSMNASTLLSRDGSALASCSHEPGMRMYADQPAPGPRPVYQFEIGNMCWLWSRAPLAGIGHVTLTVARVAWRFADEAKDATVRPRLSAAGEFELHAGSCTGPLLARLPLTPAGREPSELKGTVSTSKVAGASDLCIFATGDPRDGQWVLSRIVFSS